MTESVLAEANNYVGIPFKMGGRDRQGCDCWGLVRLFYLEQYNVDLPLFNDYTDYGEIRRYVQVGIKVIAPKQIMAPRVGDVALIRLPGRDASHVGVYVGAGKLLHIINKADSVIERADRLVVGKVERWYEIDKERFKAGWRKSG